MDGDLSCPGAAESWGSPEGQLPPRTPRPLIGRGLAGGGRARPTGLGLGERWIERHIFYAYCNEVRPRERSDRGSFLPLDKKASSYRGAYSVPLFSLSVCLSVCVTFVVFTDCESCTRPIFTNPGSMESGERGLTRGTCFAARRLELVAVAGRL